MYWDFEDLIPYGLMGLAAALIVFLGYSHYEEEKQWKSFKESHACKAVAHIKGELFNTISPKGEVGIGSTSDKTGWLCDDGKTYFR